MNIIFKLDFVEFFKSVEWFYLESKLCFLIEVLEIVNLLIKDLFFSNYLE